MFSCVVTGLRVLRVCFVLRVLRVCLWLMRVANASVRDIFLPSCCCCFCTNSENELCSHGKNGVGVGGPLCVCLLESDVKKQNNKNQT